MDEIDSKSRLKRLAVQQGVGNTSLIFLDFDGVLNNEGSVLAFGTSQTFDPVSVSLMGRLCAESGAKIVVSSSWRPSQPGALKSLLLTMARAGAGELTKNVIDYTEHLLAGKRGAEVAKWRRDNKHTGLFVVFDDDSDFFEDQPLVQTSQGRGFGLCEYVKGLDILYPLHPDIDEKKQYVGMKLGGQRLEAGWY